MGKKIIEIIKLHKIVTIIILSIAISFIPIGMLINNRNYSNKDSNKKDFCIVYFETNGGTKIEKQKVKCGSKIAQPDNPNKEGFNFKYWKYNDQEYDFNSPVLVDLILEAYYEVEDGVDVVTISFDTSGGSKIDNIQIKKGTKLSEPVIPTMSGYKFDGWYKDYEKFDFNTIITENITLKAKWIEKKDSNNIEKTSGSSSNKYKCSGSFRSDIPIKNVTIGYSDHVNWTWSTYGSYGGSTTDVCYVTYKTSDSSIATVSNSGIINTLKTGTVYISECVNDTETKKEIVCFKGQLNIQSTNDTTTVTSKYDEIANKYAGVWYLEGYSDVYIKVSKYKMYYEAMDITPTQVDIYNGGIYPNGYGNIQISYENWDADIKKYNVTLGSSYISIKTPVATYKFTKTKGNKNKYSSSKFYEALGTWYLYNKPEANFEIYKSGDDTDPYQNVSYCITPNSFSFTTLDYINASGGNLGCGSGTNNEILEKYGISISNGEMTISNGTKTVKLYKTKKTISVSNVLLSESLLNLDVGNTKTITYTINPSAAYNKNVSWSSSNNSVATVDNGVIKAIGEGTATITITTSDGNKTATCVVNVRTVPVNRISLNNNSLNLIKGNTSTLIANISPNNATNKNFTWSSSNTSVATVNSSGVVTAISKGTATITATTSDGNKTATCDVTVNNPSLSAKASIGISTIVSNSGATRGINVTITASGGTGTYNYYYIKLYKDGSLISQTSNTSNNSLFAAGYSNGSYYAEIEVHDSDGTVFNTTSGSTTISEF